MKSINIMPNEAIEMSFNDSLELLKSVIGEDNFQNALKFKIKSPLSSQKSSDWIKTTKIIGINPRITKTYWGIVKYAMTFPEEGIHIMPLWESGDGSLYVQNSWRLNRDFYDSDLETLGMDTCEKQLKFIVNVMHALGKFVGFDAVPHVDNFSEIAILNPDCVEWIKLNAEKNAQDYSVETNEISQNIKQIIIKNYNLLDNFYKLSESERSDLLFPAGIDRFCRRMEIRSLIRNAGYEPIPVVEHAPMRPVKFVRMEHSKNDSWAVFDVDNKATNALIIGAVTPYKFYNIKNGYPVKNSIDNKVLNYFIDNIKAFQSEYDFDFLRADMAHNQISHSHNDNNKDMICEEMWAVLKSEIQKNKPYFATFAESFLGNYYISGIQDMVNKNFDIVLGELNYNYLDNEYVDLLYKYCVDLKKYSFAPLLTIYTNDGDKDEHNSYYGSLEANICRYFISMFMNMPSYMGIGYEVRDLEPEKLCQYSGLYIKQGNKDYEFGTNIKQFEYISVVRELYKKYKEIVNKSQITYYDKRNDKQVVWSYEYGDKKLLCAVNLNPDKNFIETGIAANRVELVYTNSQYDEISCEIMPDASFKINNIYLGEFVIYELE